MFDLISKINGSLYAVTLTVYGFLSANAVNPIPLKLYDPLLVHYSLRIR